MHPARACCVYWIEAMSLILEALRKSEAERRRGSTPDVAMELPPVPAPRARTTPAWLLPAIVCGAIVLFAIWWWSQRDTRDASLAANETPVATSPVAEPRIESPAQPVVIARPAQAAATTATSTTATTTPTTTARTPDVSPTPPSIPQPPRLQAVPPPAPLPPPEFAQPAVADIDTTSIPPVKLSMHMWDEAPARRFVILNGQRMAEGDRNGDLLLVEIQRNGVVVERNGQRARVPLP